jgi:uncharacterized protein DUF4124
MYAKNMRLILISILVLYVSNLSAETVYKTVDEDGKVIFTDKPSEDSEEIKINDLETIKNPNPGKFRPSEKQPEEPEDYYNSLVITSPKDGEAIRSNIGNVSISLSLSPSLEGGHRIVILLDGKEVGTGTGVSLQNVDRGTHTITANVIDAEGKKIISTSSTFSLLRASK